jgi:phosphoribosylaminoimidazole carboxylase (NCAIR synthetase)
MPFVIVAVPFFFGHAPRLIEAAGSLPNVRLGVISQDPQEMLPASTRACLMAHWRVNDIFDVGQLAHAVEALSQQMGPPYRLFAAAEHLQVPLAQVREHFGIEGIPLEAVQNFRDKARMKAVLRNAGLPCARFGLAGSEVDAWRVADEVGFPLVIKPQSGAGAVSTFRVDDPDALREALAISRPTPDQPVLLEEFILGEEFSFETISLDGEAVWHSLTHYLPTPLEVLRNPWIQWCVLLPREVDHPRYDDIRHAATRALDVLGMRTGLSHMEWFRRRDGSVAISEVGARPPGAQITTLISRANDIDFVQAWARVMVYGAFDPPERRYAVGAAYLRGQGSGRVKAIHGLEQAQREIGHLVTDVQLPLIGQTQASGYEGEGYVILRHPETAVVEQALSRLISLVRVELG